MNRKRDCPVCGRDLVETVVNKVTIDFCQEHGIWLDHGELEVIQRERDRITRIYEDAAVNEAYVHGVNQGFSPWYSIFFPGPPQRRFRRQRRPLVKRPPRKPRES